MNTNGIETICKGFATTGSRRNLLKGIAGGFAAALLAAGTRSAAFAEGQAHQVPSKGLNTGGSDASGFVVDFYQAIVAGDYQSAYAILGATLQGKQSFGDFEAGFSDTAFVTVNILGTHARAGNKYRVDVEVIAWHTDGSIHQYDGSYTIGREGGVAKIVAASLHAGPTPDVLPLCSADDLNAFLEGDAGAGHRYGSVTIVNVGANGCIVGGFPSAKLVDGKNHQTTLVTGVPEQGVTAQPITLWQGHQAVVELDWTNWCGSPPTKNLSVVLSLPGSFGSITIPHNFGVPPCVASGENSNLTVGPWS
jgi:hypothetical protein